MTQRAFCLRSSSSSQDEESAGSSLAARVGAVGGTRKEAIRHLPWRHQQGRGLRRPGKRTPRERTGGRCGLRAAPCGGSASPGQLECSRARPAARGTQGRGAARTHRAGARPRTGARPARRDGHSSLGSAQPRTSLLRASREQLPGRPQEETRLWLKNAEGPFERLCDARVTALDARSRD